MAKVIAKKTADPWHYVITVDGVEIPFVTSVKIETEPQSLPRMTIELVIIEMGKDSIVIEQ